MGAVIRRSPFLFIAVMPCHPRKNALWGWKIVEKNECAMSLSRCSRDVYPLECTHGTHAKKAGDAEQSTTLHPTLRLLELSKLRNCLIDRHCARSYPIIRLPELFNGIIY